MKLTGDIVCSIIRTCAESGVTELHLGSLRVSFGKNEHAEPVQNVFDPSLQEVVAVQSIERDELAHKEEQLAQMEIEDPVAYENAIAKGDLIDSRVGDEPDEENSGSE